MEFDGVSEAALYVVGVGIPAVGPAAANRVAVFQSFLSGCISTFGDTANEPDQTARQVTLGGH